MIIDEQSVVIDFDGTICEHRFPDVGPPKPGVREAIIKIRNLGFKILIHSFRTSSVWKDHTRHRKLIENFMKENNIPYDGIVSDDKPLARFYIDDRAIRFDEKRGMDWKKVSEFVEELWTKG